MKKDVTDLGLSIYWRHSRGKKRKGGKKPPRKEIVYRVFPDVNRIGRPNAVTSIPILLGHYRLPLLQISKLFIVTKLLFIDPVILIFIMCRLKMHWFYYSSFSWEATL